ncbi:5-oxoprolinase (ATP-hydrolyzing) [Arthrobacter crystallopoietes BAB-32]|uniref:5-oxoprolinase (ATP-hydrolyzing) n=1 Tax=Arthrobacter crystallopoietes BAB-32 TaxID=1246476 RepID=N1V001_9MICC|nr:hydantoinase B/oxoprolinase family protein [Arthrobacter crystallopoietes]EMY35981.1 5-oxoprolinase (ATP-hydrolyzing) [Arthrobacter crystallopoietes BAB-32]
MTIAAAQPAIRLTPVDIEVARNRMESIAEEVGMALIRTSYSPNIKDRRDCSAGLYGPTGQLIAQAEHIPLHLGLMPTLVRRSLEQVGLENIAPGDVLLTNNPYLGGSHLPDMCVITPVFVGDRLVAVVANMAHHVDVGGIAPGSMATNTVEIFQEGVRIPPVKLYSRGELAQDLLDLVLTNVRTPDTTRGDLVAQVSANMLGGRRLHEVLDEWGADYFSAACDSLVEYAEQRTRAAISQLPDGTARFTDYLEHDGTTDQKIPITVEITKSGDELSFDFSETADQIAGALNCSYAITEACVAYTVKLLTDSTLPSNEGLMRPITVRTRPGSLVSAVFPAPVANGNTQTSMRLVDALLGAFHQIAPDVVPAASSGSQNILTIGGIDDSTGGYFSYVETYGGGQGASADLNGGDAVHTHMTNTRNTPCEVIEREYPLMVKRYEIATGTGGSGLHRGGDGLIRELEVTTSAATAVVATSRVTTRPWGLNGGEPGQAAKVWMATDREPIELPSLCRQELAKGQTIAIQTAGGGGFGPAATPTAPTR